MGQRSAHCKPRRPKDAALGQSLCVAVQMSQLFLTAEIAETAEKIKNDASSWKSGLSGGSKRENATRSALSACSAVKEFKQLNGCL
jgi:hypothetical protein